VPATSGPKVKLDAAPLAEAGTPLPLGSETAVNEYETTSPPTPHAESASVALTRRSIDSPTVGRETVARVVWSRVTTEPITGAADPHAATFKVANEEVEAGSLVRPFEAVATTCTWYVPAAPAVKEVLAPTLLLSLPLPLPGCAVIDHA